MSGPTNRASSLTPADMPASAQVNRIGGEWLRTSQLADAADTKLHIATDPRDVGPQFQIMRQVGEPAEPTPPAPPPAPTEQELRERLADRLREQHEAEQALVAAVAAHDRARDLLGERQRALASFGGLDDDVAAFTVAALRSASGKADLPGAFRDRITARDAAATDLTAATTAHVVLAAELDAARQHVEQRRQLATSAALSVLNTEAARALARYTASALAAEAAYVELCEFDRFASSTRGHPMPIGVGHLLRSPPVDLRSWVASPKLDTSRWRAALAALLNDAQAPLDPQPEGAA